MHIRVAAATIRRTRQNTVPPGRTRGNHDIRARCFTEGFRRRRIGGISRLGEFRTAYDQDARSARARRRIRRRLELLSYDARHECRAQSIRHGFRRGKGLERRLGQSAIGLITALVPGLSALGAVVLLGEPLRWNLAAGLTLVTAGILFGVRASLPSALKKVAASA